MDDFFWPVRVYYEDTDAGGVVYYANYLKFMERARTEYLRRYGLEQDVLREQHGILFVVAGVQVDYRRPARFNDLLQVGARLDELGRSRVSFSQQVFRNEAGGELLTTGMVRAACVDAETLRPRPIPDIVRGILQT